MWAFIIVHFSLSSDVRLSVVQRIRVRKIGWPYFCQSHCVIVVFRRRIIDNMTNFQGTIDRADSNAIPAITLPL
ncbi:hypothetical protein EDC04DRAFT_2815187 [Pisolithus marmoratus]|nr:hypothetical protein EDC04DRAFT_2815187 [Pisolithus marmoratus]